MIFSLLNAEPGERNFVTYLSDPLIIIGAVTFVIGAVIMLLSKTLAYRRDKTVDSLTYKNTDTYKITMTVGGIITFVGTVILIIGTVGLIQN